MLSNDLIKFKSDDFEKAENAGAIKSTNNGPEDGVTSILIGMARLATSPTLLIQAINQIQRWDIR